MPITTYQEFLGLSLGTNSSTSDSSSNHYPTSQAAEKAAQIAGARADIPITVRCGFAYELCREL